MSSIERQIDAMERRRSVEDEMFPNLPSETRPLAYALIDAGLCFYTCEPDCRGECVEAAEQAVRQVVTDNKQ